MNEFARVLIVIAASQVLLSVLKKYKADIIDSKFWLRLAVVVSCGGVAILVDWQPDGVVDWDAALKTLAWALGYSEVSYQWLIKWVNDAIERR